MQFFGLELAADIGMALNFANFATFLQKKLSYLDGSNHPSDRRISKNGSGSDQIRIGSGSDPCLVHTYSETGFQPTEFRSVKLYFESQCTDFVIAEHHHEMLF